MSQLVKQLPWSQATNQWPATLNPILSNKLLQGQLLQNVSLKAGDNTFNHMLGRMQIGWILADINASSVLYRSANFNALTLTLNASEPCTVALWVF